MDVCGRQKGGKHANVKEHGPTRRLYKALLSYIFYQMKNI